MDGVTPSAADFLCRFDSATEQIPRLREAGYKSWLQEKLTLRRQITDEFFAGQANPSYEQMKGQLRAIVTVIHTVQPRLLPLSEGLTQRAYHCLLRRCLKEQVRITDRIRCLRLQR